MEQCLQEKCDMFIQNKKTISEVFVWDSGLMSLAAAQIYTSQGVLADKEVLKTCDQMMKQSEGSFSDFRGNAKIPLICKMVLSGDPDGYFQRVKTVYKMLHQSKLMGNEYKIMAAITICDHVAEDAYEEMVARTSEIYRRMKAEHKWLTSDEDIPFAAMLAVSELDVDILITRMEEVFQLLKANFFDSNAVQTLSHVLALYEQDENEKCQKLMAIFDKLKERGHRFGTGYELAILGSVSMLGLETEELAELIIELDDYLKGQKGFGDMAIGASQRRLYAAQLVLDYYGAQDAQNESALLGSALATTVAVEVCMILCMVACIS